MSKEMPKNAFQSAKFILQKENSSLANSIYRMLLENDFVREEKLQPSFVGFLSLIKLIKEGLSISKKRFGRRGIPQNLTIVTADCNKPPERFCYQAENDELIIGMLFLARNVVKLEKNQKVKMLNQSLTIFQAVKLITVQECYHRYLIRSSGRRLDQKTREAVKVEAQQKVLEMIKGESIV